jgi:AcrR family transcriptional regulator
MGERGSGVKARYHHGSLEQALLDEAVAQVRERGVEKVSLRGLAQQVGVSASAAYQHFPDKAALLTAVGQWCFDELERRMQAQVAEVADEGDLGAVLRFASVGRAYVEFAASEPHLFRHMFGALLAKGSPHVGDDHGTGAHGMLLAALTELQERDLLRPGLLGPDLVLDLVAWSLVHGFSSLLVEGHVTREAGPPLILTFGRILLRDGAVDDAALVRALVGGSPPGSADDPFR